MRHKELTMEEIERRIAAINAKGAVELTPEEAAALAEAEAEDDGTTITLDEYKAQHEPSGKLMLRIPRSLHRTLKEAAKMEGVSLNQYMLYKLAK